MKIENFDGKCLIVIGIIFFVILIVGTPIQIEGDVQININPGNSK